MKAHKTYEIKTAKDFLSIPADKRQHCLKDFEIWLGVTDEIVNGIKELGVDSEVAKLVCGDTFVWIDDDKHDMHLTIHFSNSHAKEQNNG